MAVSPIADTDGKPGGRQCPNLKMEARVCDPQQAGLQDDMLRLTEPRS